MYDGVHFEDDPETDSTRRRMERVLKSSQPRQRWPWLAAAFGGGTVWLLWRLGRTAVRSRSAPPDDKQPADL